MPLLRWLAEVASNLFVPRQAVGVLAVIVNAEGSVLLARHATRPNDPWGLPGGWVGACELPDDAVLREVEEELGLALPLRGYVGSHVHDYGRLRPRGITLVYRLDAWHRDDEPVRPRTWEVIETRWASVAEVCAAVPPPTAAKVREALAFPDRGTIGAP